VAVFKRPGDGSADGREARTSFLQGRPYPFSCDLRIRPVTGTGGGNLHGKNRRNAFTTLGGCPIFLHFSLRPIRAALHALSDHELSMNVFAVALAALLAVLPAVLHAQDSEPIRPSDRLRFTAPSAGFATRVVGTVMEVRDGEMHVALGRSPTDPAGMLVVVPVTAVTQLERSGGPRSRVRQGIYGTVLGAGLGALAGALQSRMQTHQTDQFDRTSGRESHVTEITIAGAAIGATVGALLPGERWRPVGTTALSLDRTASRGAGLGIRLSF
jgi:hypothetical protein